MTTPHRCGGALIALAAITFAAAARADPQGNAGLTIGLAGTGARGEVWDDTVMHLGVRGDVLFARTAASDFGIGPYAELFTHGFDELQIGHGASLLVPVVDTFPLIFSAGAYGRIGDDKFGFEPGFAGTLFAGVRGHNFSSGYDLMAGLLAQVRVGLGSSEEVSIVLAAHLDAAFLGMPIVYLLDAARGGSAETDPVLPEAGPVDHEHSSSKQRSAL